MIEFLLEIIGGIIGEIIGNYIQDITNSILRILLKPIVFIGEIPLFLLSLGEIPYSTLINDEYDSRLAGFLGIIITVVFAVNIVP